ncbi:MAG: hypothetical protein ACFFCD_12865, partial [Promethearchaeota archaeon]
CVKMQFSELWKELQKFLDGKSSLDVVKDYFTLFWDSTHVSDEEMDKENIAKAESLHVALEAMEVGSFSKKQFIALIRSYS